MPLIFHNYLDMEYKDGSDDSLRRMTDEYGRHKLTDVQEENEEDSATGSLTTTRRNRYSSIGSTASSMDYLWELHPRRLSEAGLSRHSDNSTILTEDTDSFIIGQRVWVGGTKPGSIAYIGETQFAPGDWAGIVLDQPIGKNDGSVGGTRYFQCESKKGVFSRLTRLTRYPLNDAELSVTDHVTSTPINGSRRSPISPSGSTSPFKSPPSLTTSNTSLTSAHIDFKIGDRVIIKSSQGSKIGTLRFLGSTDFAAGEWCGVELDEPRGKNDGSVGGKRYFDCRSNFGLFAPISKVSKSPSNRKPGACIVHSGSGLPPSGFRRANSKESLTSNTSITSAASGVRRVRLGVTSLTTPQRASPKTPTAPLPTRTALQEVLKEKQQHIEQLLKERDLERAEIAKAASQADEAEQNLVTLKQEYELYKIDSEKNLQDHISLLTQFKNERVELLSNLEDEKRKNEDLQFRFEEAAITKADLEQKKINLSVANETNTARISELEDQLAAERQRIEALEGESNKLFEAEESLVRIKEENEALKYEIEVAAKKIQSLENEGSSNKDLVSSHEKELEHFQLVAQQKDQVIETIKTDIKNISDQYEQSRINFTREIEEYKGKMTVANNESSELRTTVDSLKAELNQINYEVIEKAVTLEKTIKSAKDVEEKLHKEINKLKMDLSGKSMDLETNTDRIKIQEEEIRQLQIKLESLKSNIEAQNVDSTNYKENAKEIESNLRKELEESRSTIKAKINEVEEIKKELAVALSLKEVEIKEAQKAIKTSTEDIEKLNATISEIKEANLKETEEAQILFSRKSQEIENRNSDLTKILHEKEESLAKSSDEIAKLQIEIASKTEEASQVQNDLQIAKKRIEEESTSHAKTNEDLNHFKLNASDLERKLKSAQEKSADLLQQKTRLENEVRGLIGSSGDFSNRLDEMSKEIYEKDKNIENLRNELTVKLQDAERSKEEIELRFNTYVQKSEKDLKDKEETISNLTTTKNSIKEEFDQSLADNKATIQALHTKINEMQNALADKENLLKRNDEDAKHNTEKSKSDLEKAIEEHNLNIASIQRKLEDALKDNTESREALSKKSFELIELESKYNQLVELSKQDEHELKSTFEMKLKELEHQIVEKEKEKSDLSEMTKNQFNQKVREMENQNLELRKEFDIKHQNLEKTKVEYDEKIKLLSLENGEMKEVLQRSNAENKEIVEDLTLKINDLESNLKVKELSLQKVIEDSTMKETNLTQQLSKYTSDLQSSLTEFQTQIDTLNKEKAEIQKILLEKEQEMEANKGKYNELFEKSQGESNTLRSGFEEEKNKLLSQLNGLTENIKIKDDEIEKLKKTSRASDLSSSENHKEIEQLKVELQINHSVIERLQLEQKDLLQQNQNLTNVDLEKERQYTELNSQMSKVADELKSVNEQSYKLQLASNLYVTVLQLLQLTEEQKIAILDKIEANIKGNYDSENYTKLCKMVDNINVVEDDTKDKRIKELEREVEDYKHREFELQTKLKKQESQIPRPKGDTQKVQDANKVTNNDKKLDNSTASSLINNNPITNEQLLEEKLLAENQVTFLNSIIIDMQKKNEEQKARIEILESGYSPAAADELGLFRLGDRKVPPRMYCDICEEFDLHETEDCPQQANEDMPAREKSPKEKPPPRPYCEICEVFGHATEDCQEDQTF